MKRSFCQCAVTGALLSLLVPSGLRADSSYRVGPEDQLKIRVARHDELGGEVVVLQDGRITLPVVGPLSVSGLTVEQIRDQITQGLRKRLVSPDVTVEIERPRPQRVFVSGAVKSSQWLDLKDGWRITEALANAGGLVVRPEVARGTLFRLPGENIQLDLARIYVDQDPTANLRLQPGDVIDIQEPPTVRIFVSGQVQKPGMIDLTRGCGPVEALAAASGPTSAAALSKAYIVKQDGRKFPVNLANLINHGLDTRAAVHSANSASSTATAVAPAAADLSLTMEAGDRLVVPENLTKIAVYGMVSHPQVYTMQDSDVTTLADAIALAGGFIARAQKSQIGIIRVVNGKQTVIEVNMNRFVKGKEINPTLQDRDIVYIPEVRKPDWSGKILPSLSALASTWFYVGPSIK
jgi:protein involved in polysaccharide export with SLBB domain